MKRLSKRLPLIATACCLWAAGALAVMAWSSGVFAADDPHAHHHHHHAMAAQPQVQRSHADYRVPGLTLVRESGAQAAFPTELDDGRPVLLNFIYTSCTAICPVLSQTFSQVQAKLGEEAAGVHMVSVSIDPEHDTPARLAEYARRHRAGPQWQHYTGSLEASIALQKAFNTYRGDKMDHTPATFLRARPGEPWVRLDGFASADDIIAEYRRLQGR